MINVIKIISSVAVLAGLTSCASIKMPNVDFIKLPEFKQEAENIPDYPNVADAPEVPKNIRSDAKWDKAAKDIVVKRDSFANPEKTETKTDAQVIREMRELAEQVDAYKKDDPQ